MGIFSNKRCSLCKEQLMDTVEMDFTSLGKIDVSACRRCDRAKCQHCKKPIGTLLAPEPRPTHCEHCGKADPIGAIAAA